MNKEILEKVSEIFHEAWMHWSKAVAPDIKNETRTQRWQKSWIPYDQLDSKTKDLDREWAEKVLEIIEPYFKSKSKELVMKYEVDSKKYPNIARVLASVDEVERKKFITTVKSWLRSKYPYADIGLVDKGGNWMNIEVGDLIADGLESRAMESLKEGLSDLFWDMKQKETYKTITPNWWSPENLLEREMGTLIIGLGEEDESDPFSGI